MRKTSKGILKRTFTVEMAQRMDGCKTKFYNKQYTGIYLANDPASAAKKAATQLCRVKKLSSKCVLFITVRETTQGSQHKEYSYKISREKNKIEGPFGNLYRPVAKSVKKKSIPSCVKRNGTPGRKVSRTRKNKPWLR